MSSTGLDVFDKTLQTTHIWLDELMQEIGPDRGVDQRPRLQFLRRERRSEQREEQRRSRHRADVVSCATARAL